MVKELYPFFVEKDRAWNKGNNKVFDRRWGCTPGFRALLARVRKVARPTHEAARQKKIQDRGSEQSF